MGNLLNKKKVTFKTIDTATDMNITTVNTEVQTDTIETLDIEKLTVKEVYFKNSQWRMRANNPDKLDFIFFEHYDPKTKQWKLQHRIIF